MCAKSLSPDIQADQAHAAQAAAEAAAEARCSKERAACEARRRTRRPGPGRVSCADPRFGRGPAASAAPR
jgi:hypothetical protein